MQSCATAPPVIRILSFSRKLYKHLQRSEYFLHDQRLAVPQRYPRLPAALISPPTSRAHNRSNHTVACGTTGWPGLASKKLEMRGKAWHVVRPAERCRSLVRCSETNPSTRWPLIVDRWLYRCKFTFVAVIAGSSPCDILSSHPRCDSPIRCEYQSDSAEKLVTTAASLERSQNECRIDHLYP